MAVHELQRDRFVAQRSAHEVRFRATFETSEGGARGFGQHRQANGQGGNHQHRAQDVGQHMAKQDARPAHADQAHRIDIVLVLFNQGDTAHRSCVLHPVGQRNRHHHNQQRQLLVHGARQHGA